MKKIMLMLALILVSNSLFSQLEVVWQKTFPAIIDFAKFSKDGKLLYCAIGDSIVVMDPISGERLRRFEGTRPYPCNQLSISNSGNYLISMDGGGGFDLWDINNEMFIKHYSSQLRALFISNDDKYMYWLYYDGYMRIIDIKNDSIIKQVQTHKIQSAKLSNNGKILALGYPYNGFNQMGETVDNVKLELWDAENLKLIKVLQDTKSSDGYWNFEFSKDDNYFAATSAIKQYTTVYDLIQNKISFNSEYSNYNFKFTSDNSKLLYYASKSLDLIKESGEKYHYDNAIGTKLETSGSIENWYVLNGVAKWWILYRNVITSVDSEISNVFTISPNPATDYIEISLVSPSIKTNHVV